MVSQNIDEDLLKQIIGYNKFVYLQSMAYTMAHTAWEGKAKLIVVNTKAWPKKRSINRMSRV